MNGRSTIPRALFSALLLLCARRRQVSSFAPAASAPIARGSYGPVPFVPPRSATRVRAATLSSSSPASSKQSIRATSDELLALLQQKAASSRADATLDDRIDALVRTLISSKSRFDPARCIDGPLFASVHFIGETPLWEKIASAGGVRNVKGQRYTLDLDGGGKDGTFVNYAEVWGSSFYLKAVGDCRDEGPVAETSSTESSSDDGKSDGPFGALASLFGPGSGSDSNSKGQPALLPTPYDYSATVTGASIVLFDKFSLDLSIEGTGTVRVLYADENLRIFLSPTDTNVTKGADGWESAGLIVAQVRVDMVYDDWVDRL